MGKTILAIDDDRSMLDLYEAILAEFGEIRTAINLEEARRQLAGVDLIILDFYLANDEVLIQDLVPEFKKAAPVLLCSGIQELRVPEIGVELGIAGYWNKSSDHERLRSLVRSVLGSGKQAAPS